jgi:hypothetical protein
MYTILLNRHLLHNPCVILQFGKKKLNVRKNIKSNPSLKLNYVKTILI